MSRRSKKQPSKPHAKPPVSLQTTVVHTIHKPPVRPAFQRAEPFSATFRARRWQITFVCLALICATLLVYVKVGGFGFIDYDDPAMVKENSHINTGLTWDNIAWAFTDLKLYYWHPLTYLSHMLDCQLFGLDRGRRTRRTSLFTR